ncbi:NUDIX hydrolase [Halomarina litorea]|uniref:NUDIX hydrolase n=1 Tax=Halomarina litorea TaxID=2961595 RepID=UPI0020C487C1|nr:NUDIX hydrolase [Halomarina sp. BCD28]
MDEGTDRPDRPEAAVDRSGWRREWSRSVGARGVRAGYDRLRRPDGESRGTGWVEDRPAVAIVAKYEGQVVFVEEYRPRLRETVLTCPMGRVEAGESIEAAGRRELREETGFEAGRVESLGEHYPVAWLRKSRGVVVADDLEPGTQDRDDDEFVAVRLVPVEDALDRAREGVATGWTLLPLLLAREAGVLG